MAELRCIRERRHIEQDPRHVWLESFDVIGRIPVLVTWVGSMSTEPVISSVLTPRDAL